VKLRLEGAQA
jgi:hypothetical protein